MRLNARARCAFSCFALALGCLIHTSDASSPEQDVRAAVDALDGQLGDNANAVSKDHWG